MISAIMPVLNGERYIREAIDSFLKQGVDSELIIVDGGSTDKTEEIVKSFKSKKIRYYDTDLVGTFEKTNYGLERMKGNIFFIMACDIRLFPDAFRTVEREIKEHEALLGNIVFSNEKGEVIGESNYPVFDLREYREGNFLASCAIFAKYKKGMKFNLNYPHNADYDFYLRLAHQTKFKQISNYLMNLIMQDNQEEKLHRGDVHRAEIIERVKREYSMPEYIKPKVLVAVCNEGWIRPEVATACYQISSDQRVSSKIYFPSVKTYENNLSQVALKVKKEGWDYLLIIDADNPPQRNPIDLIALNLDVVALPTPQWNDIDPYPIYWVAMDRVKGGYNQHENRVGLQEVDAVGSGCVLIKRKVLESLEAPFTRKWNKDGTMDMGVDFHFCEQAKAKGFRIWAHYDYICDHFKELSLLKVLEFKNK